jgi:RNA polymerase sigma-70 factor (ECF subfamily)
MSRYRDGDAAAFEVLYARHKGGLYRYLLRQLQDRSSAEEIFQEVWMNLINSRERYRVKAKFTTLLYRIAHNRVVDHYRSRAYRNSLATEHSEAEFEPLPDDSTPGPDRVIEANRQVEKLNVLIGQLPHEQREVFLLHQEAGLSLELIAQITGNPRETVKSRLRYALTRLRTAMSGDQQESHHVQ